MTHNIMSFGTKSIQNIYTKMKATGPGNGQKESKVGSKGFLKKIFEYQHGSYNIHI